MGKPDPAQFVRELASFQTELTRPITGKLLDVWIAGIETREFLLAGTVWGTIRWRKSLGRPLLSPMSGAFEIRHGFWQEKTDYVEGGYKTVEIYAPLAPPSKWDGPDDDDYHRVSFTAEAKAGDEQLIAVAFAAGVPWQPTKPFQRASHRVIDPPQRGFHHDGRRTVLEPFNVIRKSFAK